MNSIWAVCTRYRARFRGPNAVLCVWACLLLTVALSTGLRFQHRLSDRLDPGLDGVELAVSGEVASLPVIQGDYLSFRFRPSPRQAQLGGLPGELAVRWFEDFPEIATGERWRLRIRLRIPKGLVNFQVFDRERQWFADGIGGLATVIPGENRRLAAPPPSGPREWRYSIREAVRSALPPGPGRAVALSLAIADRGEFSPEQWQLFRQTGTGHLLAISGLHVGLAAIAGFWITRVLLWVSIRWSFPGRLALSLSCLGSFAAAATYGVMAGFPVSTLRALAMLGLGLYAIASRRSQSPLRIWVMAALLVLCLDPLALIRPGFWLSFGAVLALIMMFAARSRRAGYARSILIAQLAILAIMPPITAFWFQSSSWLGFPANLLAIPWVSLVTVPLVLPGTVVTWLSGSSQLLSLASLSAEWILEILAFLRDAAGGGDWVTPSLTVFTAVLGALGGSLLLLPRGIGARWMGACLLLLCFLPRDSGLANGDFEVQTLDVGQGLAVIVRTRQHVLLYDTGPGDGRSWSLAERVLVPALNKRGRVAPDLIVASHADLDHAGGLADLRRQYPQAAVWLNRPADGEPRISCEDSRAWRWDSVDFRVLHPTRWLPYSGNDSSCVILIENGEHRALLTGDISSTVESRLLARLPQADMITVPHHGSSSSSGKRFVETVRPGLAVASVSHDNRVGFPRPEVTRRYDSAGSPVVSTSDCGAVLARFSPGTDPWYTSARIKRDAPWRWAGRATCPGRAE